MNKKVLALAVAAAIASPLAMAETTLYGSLDVSIDHISQPKGNAIPGPDFAPTKDQTTNQLSSNISNIGVRGSHDIGPNLKGVYQIETEANLVSTPDNHGSLASRNSFVGIASPAWGAVKAGKTDTPYKTSTGGLDPFSRTVGDYNSIMGNTGGDNRVEFDQRVPHSIWYESPKFSGFEVNALLSPGQHLNGHTSGVAQGEGSNCSGGNTSTSTNSCQDGGQGTIWSASAIYNAGPIFATAAYELHKDVNRVADDFGDAGVANESAWKLGAAYNFGTNRLAAVYEKLRRDNPAVGAPTEAQNPDNFADGQTVALTSVNVPGAGRNKTDYYLSDVQKLPGNNEIMAAWAHAGKSDRPDGVDDAANMYAIGAAHHFNKWMQVYAVYAEDRNHTGGHYGLGQSGHGIVVNPSNTAGQTFKAFSVGTRLNF